MKNLSKKLFLLFSLSFLYGSILCAAEEKCAESKASRESEVEINQRLFLEAAQKGDTEVLSKLAYEVDPDFQDYCGNTALIYAVGCGHQKAIELLLTYANPKIKNCAGKTALMFTKNPDIHNMINTYIAYHDNYEIYVEQMYALDRSQLIMDYTYFIYVHCKYP